MSPPTKAPEAPELERQPELPANDTSGPTIRSAPAVAPPQAAILRGQQTAGNQAVVGVLGAPRGVQRAPNDDDPRRTSGLATGPTLDSSGGVAIAPTLVDPARSGMAHGPTLDASGGLATGPTLPQAGGAGPPGGGPGDIRGAPTGAGSASLGDFSPQAPRPAQGGAKHPANIKPPVAATQGDAEAAYRRDPGLVHRSTNDSVHGQFWRVDPRAEGGPPPVFRSGKTYIIHPDLEGSALPPRRPPVPADERMESDNIRAMSAHLDKAIAAKRGPVPEVAPTRSAPPMPTPGGPGTGHTTAPFKPIPFEPQPWERPGPSSIPGGLRPPAHLGGGGGSPPPTPADGSGLAGPAGPGTVPGTGIEPRTPAPRGGGPGGGGGTGGGGDGPGGGGAGPTGPVGSGTAHGVGITPRTPGPNDAQVRAARRVERANVQPIHDPNEAARIYLDGRAGAGGNLAIARREMFENKWRYEHDQHRQAPVAGWTNADGTVVIDKSNPQVKDAVERLARERGGGGSAPVTPGGGPGPGTTPPGPGTGGPAPGTAGPGTAAPVPAAPGQRPPLAATGAGTAPPPSRQPAPLGATGVGTAPPPSGPGGGPGPSQGPGPAPGPGGGPAFVPATPGTTGGGPARAWPNPKPVAPGEFAGVDPKEKITPIPKPREAMRGEVEPLGQIDPRRVIKSPNENWHYNAWHHSQGPYYYGKDAPAPQFFKVGDTYYASPDYKGPGTTLPNYSGDDKTGLGKPGPGGPGGTAPTGTPAPTPPKTGAPAPPDKLRQAVAPYTPFTPEPRGTQRAQPVTRTEVMEALAANPNSVVKSPDQRFHRQGYRADGGGREAPGAYKVGDLYVVAHDYPVPVQKLAVPGTQAPGTPAPGGPAPTTPGAPGGTAPQVKPALPAPTPTTGPDPTTKAAQTISPTGYVPQEQKGAKWDLKKGELTRETAQEEKRVTDQGVQTRTRSNTKGYSLAKGGSQEWKDREETQAGDKFSAKEKATKLTADLGGINLNRQTVKETGTTPDGPKAKTEKNIGGGIGPGGLTGTAGAEHTTAGGTKAEAKADIKLGPDGIALTGTAQMTTPKGFTGHLSVSGKHNVVASDPKPLPNGKFAVEYVVTDENGVELGGGWNKPGGGASVSVQYGQSTTTKDFQTRVFGTKAEAAMFQLMAAAHVAADTRSFDKATSADDVLKMQEGEVRGTSKTDTDSLGGSGGMSVVSVGVTSTDSTTTGLKVEKMAGNKVRVTPSIAEQEALNASISVAGKFGNTKGESTTKSFSVTYEFDLGTEGGKQAFETYKKQRLPPPMPPHAKWIDTTTGLAMEDHDVYKFAHIGEIGWGSHATQQTVVDEAGSHTTVVGGQTEKVQLNAIRKLTMDKNRHAEANIVGRMTNGQVTSLAGQLTVGGEDGSFNRDQFRKIFMDKGAPAGTEVKSSGEWTLSADIDKKMFESLERDNDKMKQAKTREERLKIYSEMARAGGAQMLGGQVRMGSGRLAWNLELKGDPNFPGAAGRAVLNQQRAKLQAQLKERPDNAGSVAAEAKDAITALSKRLKDVSDKKKYTDLPDELRQEQVDVINTHMAEFKSVRSQALSVQMRGGRREDLTVVLKRAADEHGYDDVKMENRAWRKAQDLVTIHETEISVLEGEIAGTRAVVAKMFGRTNDVRWGKGVNVKVYQTHNQRAKDQWGIFKSMAPRLTEAVTNMRSLKEQWSAEPDPKSRENLLRQYDGFCLSTIQIMDVQLNALREAAKDAYVVTGEGAVTGAAALKVIETIKADKTARLNALAGLDDDGSVVE